MKAAVGREEAVLIEEPFAGEPLAVGRTWFQAPEVDGCVVVKGGNPKAGDVWLCRIVAANGPDLEAEALRGGRRFGKNPRDYDKNCVFNRRDGSRSAIDSGRDIYQ